MIRDSAAHSYRPLKYFYSGPFHVTAEPWALVEGVMSITSALGSFDFPLHFNLQNKVQAGTWKVCAVP